MFREIAGNALLSSLNLPINSAAKCCASEAEPPLPHIRIFLSCFIVLTSTFADEIISLFSNLAYNNFTMEEMQNGVAWNILNG